MADTTENYSVNNEGEVRTRDAEGQPTGEPIGFIDRIEDGFVLYQAMTTGRVAIGEAEETRAAALQNLISSLK